MHRFVFSHIVINKPKDCMIYSYQSKMSWLIIGLFVFWASFTQAGPLQSTTYKTDTIKQGLEQIYLADPTIFYDDGRYFLYGTHATNRGFEVYVSTDLKNWKKKSQLALSKKNAFGDHGFWAPQVFKLNHQYYMAYTANEHIAIAVSDSPLGPFRQKEKKPLIEDIKTIDPFVFIEETHKYLYYVKLEEGNRLFVAELKDDLSGIKPQTEKPCINAVTNPQAWENTANVKWTVTEGPTVLKHKGKYYLFYSANDFRNIDYAVGYAVSDNPLGPWKKYSGNPILSRKLIGENGPGHGDFFKSKDGQYYYVFHTHFSKDQVSPRKTAIIKGNFIPMKESDAMMFDKNSFYHLQTK